MEQKNLSLKILCVSPPGKGRDFMQELINNQCGAGCAVSHVSGAADAKKAAKSEKFDICLVNSPIADGDPVELAAAAADGDAAVLLFVKEDSYDSVCEKTANKGIFTVGKPNSIKLFNQAANLIFTVKRREKLKEDKIQTLEAKLDEIKIINRAKLVLMQYLKMDESKAHRYIEKQAMDRRVTRREVAEIIISTYEY